MVFMLIKSETFSVSSRVQRRRQSLGSNDAAFLRQKLDAFVYPQIKAEPFWGNIKKLRRYNPETWRYRIGKFRLFYMVDPDEKVVFMLAVDYRKDAYR